MGRRKVSFRQLNSPLTYLSAKILFSDRFIHSLHLPFFRASSSTNEKAPFSVRVGLPEAAATVMVAVGSPLALAFRIIAGPSHLRSLRLHLFRPRPAVLVTLHEASVRERGLLPPPVLYPAVRPTCKWPMMPGMRQRWATRTWRSCRNPPLRSVRNPPLTSHVRRPAPFDVYKMQWCRSLLPLAGREILCMSFFLYPVTRW